MAVTAGAVATRDERRGRRRQMVGTLAGLVAVLVLSGFFFNGWVPSALLLAGPLDGAGGGITMPVQPGDTGAALGVQLTNPSGSDVVIDSVTVGSDTGLQVRGQPYVWDVTGRSSLAAWDTPLPAQWQALARHPVHGYLVRHALHGSQTAGAALPEAEIVFEFGVPPRSASLSTVTVRYHIGLESYRKTFETDFTLCPAKGMHLCGW